MSSPARERAAGRRPGHRARQASAAVDIIIANPAGGARWGGHARPGAPGAPQLTRVPLSRLGWPGCGCTFRLTKNPWQTRGPRPRQKRGPRAQRRNSLAGRRRSSLQPPSAQRRRSCASPWLPLATLRRGARGLLLCHARPQGGARRTLPDVRASGQREHACARRPPAGLHARAGTGVCAHLIRLARLRSRKVLMLPGVSMLMVVTT